MTPLFAKTVGQLTKPKSERTLNDNGRILPLMTDVHCFELTEALPYVDELTRRYWTEKPDASLCFLPAAKTWIEYETDGERQALLLHGELKQYAYVTTVLDPPFGSVRFNRVPLVYDHPVHSLLKYFGDLLPSQALAFVSAALTVINSPRDVGRIKPAVSAKLPEPEAMTATPFWPMDGALSVQHPSQADMFAGPRTLADRETA